MAVLDIIKSRRSIRAYKSQPVEKEKMDQLLEAAIWAPSSHNSQPWHFTVIKNDGLGKELNEATKEVLLRSDKEVLQKLGKRPDLFYGAPIIVVVSGLKGMRSAIIDCSAAVQNMLLVAEDLGLATCWNGLVTNLFMETPDHPVINALNLPEAYEPFYAVAVGYPERKQEPPYRKGSPIVYLDY
jgi:nitroreductase